jgi:uncharacterized protein (UPF0297 family)
MSDGININVGTDNSSLDRSNVTIGDVGGSGRLSDHFYERIKDLEREVKEIKSFLAGSSLGEPGLTQRVNDAIAKIRSIEKDLSMLDVIDSRLDKQDELFKELRNMLELYRPMLEEMRLVYRTKTPIPVSVFYAVLIVLFLSVLVVYLLVWIGRG